MPSLVSLCTFFGQGVSGYKPCFRTWQWRPANAWSTVVVRYWYSDTRDEILDYLDELRREVRKQDALSQEFIERFERAIEGIRTLLDTYSDDKHFCKQVRNIVRELDEWHTHAVVARMHGSK
jgi:hypothetical protein